MVCVEKKKSFLTVFDPRFAMGTENFVKVRNALKFGNSFWIFSTLAPLNPLSLYKIEIPSEISACSLSNLPKQAAGLFPGTRNSKFTSSAQHLPLIFFQLFAELKSPWIKMFVRWVCDKKSKNLIKTCNWFDKKVD